MIAGFKVRIALLVVLALVIPIAGMAMLQQTGAGSDKIVNEYINSQPNDPIVGLQKRLDSGQTKLEFDSRWGYLPSILRELKISPSSQTLVFSKTSFQIDHISVQTPRALYFNDDVYVGWVQGGPVLEFGSVDPKLGAIFYTMDQKKDVPPQFDRQVEGCLVCHDSSSTGSVPGFMMRSVLPDIDGNVILSAGTSVMTDRSPLAERFGGWYATGKSGSQYHRGNNYFPNIASVMGNPKTYFARTDMAATSNLETVPKIVDTSRYLGKYSDIVSLMVMTHQTQLHNIITQVSYEVRAALKDDANNPQVPEITQNRIRTVTEPLVKAMLFAWTPPFSAPITGVSGFTEHFEKQGPFDKQGRSLRQFDLKTRLFRYPLSFLVYSDAFDDLPAPARNYVYRRFRDILSGKDRSMDFSHLSEEDRSAILQILEDTKPDFKIPEITG